jgi:hypothetical protein
MNFPKPMAVLIIVGMLIQTAVPPVAFDPIFNPTYASPVQAEPPESMRKPLGERPSLPAVAQESESIDSFSVHPANRWSEVETGTGYLDSITNGEFMFNTNSNDSSSMYRYRNAETTAGDIETRWRLDWVENTTNGDDWETPLMGLNVTTSEGDGNATLNAYPWNSTHYTLRPTFTTDDGANWRSWNLESDYQDYMALAGEWGADGFDFIEGIDDWATGGAITSTLGYLQVITGAGVFDGATTGVASRPTLQAADESIFHTLQMRFRINDTVNTYRMAAAEAGVGEVVTTFTPTGSWQTKTLTASSVNWNLFQLAKNNHATIAKIEIDYCIVTNNDSSDLTFYDYQTYYRAKLAYNLLTSKLALKTTTDGGTKINGMTQGSWSIADYFDADELIPDINLGEVGEIDYLFGLRSAGANATCWWDFYAADFQEFNWFFDSTLSSPADVFPLRK